MVDRRKKRDVKCSRGQDGRGSGSRGTVGVKFFELDFSIVEKTLVHCLSLQADINIHLLVYIYIYTLWELCYKHKNNPELGIYVLGSLASPQLTSVISISSVRRDEQSELLMGREKRGAPRELGRICRCEKRRENEKAMRRKYQFLVAAGAQGRIALPAHTEDEWLVILCLPAFPLLSEAATRATIAPQRRTYATLCALRSQYPKCQLGIYRHF